MNKANSQKNFEVQLESTRNYAEWSPTVLLKPHPAINSERTTGKRNFWNTNPDLNTQVCGNMPYHSFPSVLSFVTMGSANPVKAASAGRSDAHSASPALCGLQTWSTNQLHRSCTGEKLWTCPRQ